MKIKLKPNCPAWGLLDQDGKKAIFFLNRRNPEVEIDYFSLPEHLRGVINRGVALDFIEVSEEPKVEVVEPEKVETVKDDRVIKPAELNRRAKDLLRGNITKIRKNIKDETLTCTIVKRALYLEKSRKKPRKMVVSVLSGWLEKNEC